MFRWKNFLNFVVFSISLLLCNCGGIDRDNSNEGLNASTSGNATTLSSIEIVPSNASMPRALVKQYTATGIFADDTTRDITSEISWSSEATSIATINNAGQVTSISPGSTTIKASASGISGKTTLTVLPQTLSSISVTPTDSRIPRNGAQQFTAIGTYSDSTTGDVTSVVTWSSSNVAVATINGTGLATGIATGNATIKATAGTISATATVKVINRTWTTTPDYASVSTCIAKASAGDTINFTSSGSATWSSTITVSKALTINGNGTTLTASGSLPYGFFFLHNFTSTDLMRINGFTFQMNNGIPQRAIYITTVDLLQLRIDHNIFYHGSTQMEISGAKGVIDNNYFYNALAYSIIYSAGTRAQADASWVSMAAGTSDALFIENNNFIVDSNFTGTGYGTTIDTYNGGKLVIRYNNFDSTNSPSSILSTVYPIQLHGNACGGCTSTNKSYWQNDSTARRGQSVVEIYNNTMAGRRIDRLATIRGSAALIYDNTITGTVAYNPMIYFYEEEYDLPSQFYPSRTNWPAEDQTHNTFIWNNTYKGHDFNDGVYGYVASTSTLQKDRDYFLHTPCSGAATTDGYGNTCTHGKATFTGANGASGSYPTDGTTYPTKGTIVFTSTGDNAYLGYTPYNYPHPLTVQ